MTTLENSSVRRLFTKELVAVIFVASVAFFSGELLNPVLPLYLSELGITPVVIGYMTGAMMIGVAISEIFWGWVIDRVDLKFAIFFGTVLLGTSIGLLLFTKTIPSLILVLFMYGFCRSPIYVIGRWYMSVNSPPNMRAFAMAMMATITFGIGAMGGFASGYVAEYKGYHFSFSLSSGLAIGAGLLILILGRWLNFGKHKQQTAEKGPEKPLAEPVSQTAKLITVALGGIGVLFFICMGISMTYLPLIAAHIGVPTSQIGVLYGIRGILSTIIMMPIGRFCDRKDKWMILAIGLGIVAISMFVVASAGNFGWLVAAMLLYALGSATYTPTITSLISHSIPVSWTGTAYGIFGFMEDIGWMIGPVIGGILWESINPQMPFIVAGLAVLLGAPLVLLIKSRLGSGIVNQIPGEQVLELKVQGD